MAAGQGGDWVTLRCSDFHLSNLVGVVVTLASYPVDAIRITLMGARQVAPVEVGLVAVVVPPGSVEQSCTIHAICIIILVTGRKWHVVVLCQGVSCKDTYLSALRAKAEPIPDGQGQLAGSFPHPHQ